MMTMMTIMAMMTLITTMTMMTMMHPSMIPLTINVTIIMTTMTMTTTTMTMTTMTMMTMMHLWLPRLVTASVPPPLRGPSLQHATQQAQTPPRLSSAFERPWHE